MNQLNSSAKMPLKGLAIGDGLYNPDHQLDYSNHLYEIGLADEIQKQHYKELYTIAVLDNKNGNLAKAAKV